MYIQYFVHMVILILSTLTLNQLSRMMEIKVKNDGENTGMFQKTGVSFRPEILKLLEAYAEEKH